jgi:uncharacterized protein
VIALGVIGLFIVGIVVLGGVVWAANSGGDGPVTRPVPTYPVKPTQPTGSPPSVPTVPTVPTVQPTVPRPSPTQTTPPPPSASDIVTKNRIYVTGVQRSVGCREPSLRPSNGRNASNYWALVKQCLDSAWPRHVRAAGYEFRAPRTIYWAGDSVDSPCGGGFVAVPFYCSGNETLYMKVDVFVKNYNKYPDAENRAYTRMWYSRSVAHEYGHHLQHLTGILEAAHDLRYQAPNREARLEMSRRIELQANCLAGVFLGANRRSYPISGTELRMWNQYVVTAGDPPGYPRDHGSGRSNQRFMGYAFKTMNPGHCATFRAPSAHVT